MLNHTYYDELLMYIRPKEWGFVVFLFIVNLNTFSENVILEVAANNEPAVRLYNRLGFLNTQELRTWYDVSKPSPGGKVPPQGADEECGE